MSSVQKKLFKIRQKKRDLKRRIAQSQRDSGRGGTTGNCKDLQRYLSKLHKKQKNIQKKARW